MAKESAKATKKEVSKTEESPSAPEKMELNLEEKVTIRNIAGWNVGFARIADGIGDVNITPNGTARLTRNEIIAQVQNGNKLFTGTDGNGSHATIFIDDSPTRIEVGFDGENGEFKQTVFSEEKIKELFGISNKTTFENSFSRTFSTRAEKYASIETIRKLKLNDYAKIKFVEKYTGYTL